jgi:formiminotetrahydrofolate cyclodeaminase
VHEVSQRFRDMSVADFIDRLASPDPVPGGGSAAAVAASLGAGLVAMVAELSKRPKYMEHAALHGEAQASGRELADRLLALADEDAAAYGAFAAALKLPRDTEAETEARSQATRAAARLASEVPLRCLEACLETVVAAESLAGRCNQNASSDLTVASLLAEAGARGAAVNVLVNLAAVEDAAWASEMDARVSELLEQISRTAATCREVVAAGGRRAPLTRAGVPA